MADGKTGEQKVGPDEATGDAAENGPAPLVAGDGDGDGGPGDHEDDDATSDDAPPER